MLRGWGEGLRGGIPADRVQEGLVEERRQPFQLTG
jgi:hypothetical protein